tara:strand:- start:349 stop:1512 length:1164 start_codon:yes stop_codon:yes gene_type:complete
MFEVAGLDTNRDFANFLNGKTNKDNQNIKGISFDSRTIRKDQIFIPLRGEKFDGKDYIHDALKKGAFALTDHGEALGNRLIIVQDIYTSLLKLCQKHISELDLKTVFVTGSYGKTTLKDMLKISLGESCHASIDNQNNEYGIPYTILGCSSEKKYLIVECGARKNRDFNLLAKHLKCDVFIITGIAHNHIETMGSIKNIEKTKLELLKCLKNKDFFIDGREIIEDCYIEKNKVILKKALSYLGAGNYDPRLKFELPSGRGNIIKFMGSEIIDQSYNSSPYTLIETTKNLDPSEHILILGDMAELGKKEKQLHKEVITKLSKFELVVTGKIFEETLRKLNLKNILYFSDLKSFPREYLIGELKKSKKLYFKGSRSSKMEIYIDALLNG